VEEAMVDGRARRRGRREQEGIGAQTRRMAAVIGRLVGQHAMADRDAGAGARHHVEKHEIAAAPQHARLRDDVLVPPRLGVLHGEVHAAHVGLRREIHAGPRRQRAGHADQRRAGAAVQDTARVHVLGPVGEHEDGAVVRELGDGDAETLGEGDPREAGARILDVSSRHPGGS
jgi:hypothetical protein